MRYLSFSVLLALAVVGISAPAGAQTYPLFRTVTAPGFIPQASFYNPVRDELVVIAYEGDSAQIYDAGGNLVRATAALPTALGAEVDGAAYDGVGGVALVVRHNCEVIEIDPVTLSILSRRTLGGSGLVPAPTLCAGVDVGIGGTLFVADYNTPRIIEYARVGTVPLRAIDTSIMLADNLARLPGTNLLMVATNQGNFAIYSEAGALSAGPATLGTGIVLGAHTRSNSAGSDGLTFVGTSGRLWFCDHNDPVVSCYLQTRGCTGDVDCPLPFIGCDVPTGLCLSAVCGDGRIQGGEECDDGDVIPGDGCSAGCVVEPGFVCNGEPSMCGTCTDDTAFMTDTGCTDARPHCRTTGPRAPACEVCIDSSPDAGDLGCSPAAAFCIRNTTTGLNQCVACLDDTHCDDRNECTNDHCDANVCSNDSLTAGTMCTGGVCSGAPTDRCVECIDDSTCAAGFVCGGAFVCVPVGVDAGPEPDAAIELPDAAVELPDAFVELPDAFVPPGVDAGPLPDAAVVRPDAGRADAASAPIDAASAEADAGPTTGTFVGGAVCSVSTGQPGSRTAWALVLTALALVVSRRRNRSVR